MPKKLALAHLPTPLWRSDALDRLMGGEIWVKRDDMSSGAAAGNKIRKLEYLLAEALERGARAVITCGGAQSNHARASAVSCVELGLRPILFLRTATPETPPASVGNLLLDRLVGAELRFITPAQYRERDALMTRAARELEARGEPCYVIPEGGSNGLGSLGYVDAMREVREQLDLGFGPGARGFDAIVHACGSGGTAAGVALGAARYGVAPETRAIAVCDDRTYFERVTARIVAEARALDPSLPEGISLKIHADFKGPAYGVASAEQLEFFVRVARTTGLCVDPVYTGKALFGLARLAPDLGRVLFVHTGGLPGLLAESEAFVPVLG
jgi:D-cysteine desulfhydrase